jgi:SAM-dependent methyltransferase
MNLWELTDHATPWSVHVAATLRVADHIAAGKSEIGELAAAAGADRDALQRVLRHLVSKGVFEEPEVGRFALNDLARGLLGDSNRLGLDLDGIGGRMAYPWSSLLSAVRSGKPAYQEVFGHGFWEDLQANPKISAEFDALMGPPGHGIPDPTLLANPADWESVRTVVDVGGGTGALLAEVLRTHSQVRGILVDLPRTVARAGELFEAAGVADRVSVVGQSFFDPLPPGGDIYILKGVLHDWPDPEATAILKRCAEAARPSGRVVVFTNAGPSDKASPELLMLVLVGGKDRTFDEFRAIAREAGLEVTATGRQRSGRWFVECRPV